MSADSGSLKAGDAYRLWAPCYNHETVLSVLDEEAVGQRWAQGEHTRLLDAGCGTGRRIPRGPGHPHAFGIDPVLEMLLQEPPPRAPVAAACVESLPFRAEIFDLIWLRLVIGHIARIDLVYQELSRVLANGGFLVVTDLHPDAARRGHQRSFGDATGRHYVAQHFVHDETDHRDNAALVGLACSECRTLTVGESVREFYEKAGRLEAYERQRDEPMLLAITLTK